MGDPRAPLNALMGDVARALAHLTEFGTLLDEALAQARGQEREVYEALVGPRG